MLIPGKSQMAIQEIEPDFTSTSGGGLPYRLAEVAVLGSTQEYRFTTYPKYQVIGRVKPYQPIPYDHFRKREAGV